MSRSCNIRKTPTSGRVNIVAEKRSAQHEKKGKKNVKERKTRLLLRERKKKKESSEEYPGRICTKMSKQVSTSLPGQSHGTPSRPEQAPFRCRQTPFAVETQPSLSLAVGGFFFLQIGTNWALFQSPCAPGSPFSPSDRDRRDQTESHLYVQPCCIGPSCGDRQELRPAIVQILRNGFRQDEAMGPIRCGGGSLRCRG